MVSPARIGKLLITVRLRRYDAASAKWVNDAVKRRKGWPSAWDQAYEWLVAQGPVDLTELALDLFPKRIELRPGMTPRDVDLAKRHNRRLDKRWERAARACCRVWSLSGDLDTRRGLWFLDVGGDDEYQDRARKLYNELAPELW